MQMLSFPWLFGWLFLVSFISFGAYVYIARPMWFGKLMMLCGMKGGYDDHFYPFNRWTWKEPPHHWRLKTLQCIFWMMTFGALVFYFVFTKPDPKPWPIIAVAAFLSIHFLFFTLRIYLRVKRLNAD